MTWREWLTLKAEQLGFGFGTGQIKQNPQNVLGVDKLGRAHWRSTQQPGTPGNPATPAQLNDILDQWGPERAACEHEAWEELNARQQAERARQEKLARLRSPAFKAWFGDWEHDPEHASRVVDRAGEPQETHGPLPPRVLYHGTGRAGFTAFDPAQQDPNALYGAGFYFTESREVAAGYSRKGSEHTKVSPTAIEQIVRFIRKHLPTDNAARQWRVRSKGRGVMTMRGWVRSSHYQLEETRKGSVYFDVNLTSENYLADYAYKQVPDALGWDEQTRAHWKWLCEKHGWKVDQAGPGIKECYLNIRKPFAADGELTAEDAARLYAGVPFQAGEPFPDIGGGVMFQSDPDATHRKRLIAALDGFHFTGYPSNAAARTGGKKGKDLGALLRAKVYENGETALEQLTREIVGNRGPYGMPLGGEQKVENFRGYFGARLENAIREATGSDAVRLYSVTVKEIFAKAGYRSQLSADQWLRKIQREGEGHYAKHLTGEKVFDHLKAIVGTEGMQRLLTEAGYDGITHVGGKITGGEEHRVWIAFKPTQIKAVNNEGTFNPADPDITKGWFGGHHEVAEPGKRGGHWFVRRTGHIGYGAAPLTRTPQGPGLSPESHASAEYAQLKTRSPAFKHWFGDWEQDPAHASKVVTDKGEPAETHRLHVAVVYHGTAHGGFTQFDPTKGQPALYGRGFYFTEDPSIAREYATGKDRDARAHSEVKACYLNIRDPFRVDRLEGGKVVAEPLDTETARRIAAAIAEHPDPATRGFDVNAVANCQDLFKRLAGVAGGEDAASAVLRRAGFDGITHVGGLRDTAKHHRVWIAFKPNQIKAVANMGTFDPQNPDITKADAKKLVKFGRLSCTLRKAEQFGLFGGPSRGVTRTVTRLTSSVAPRRAVLHRGRNVLRPGIRGGKWRVARTGEIRYDPAPVVETQPKTPEVSTSQLGLSFTPRPVPVEEAIRVTAIAAAIGPQPDPKKAAKLRATADKMQERIDYLHDPAISHQNVTARRARIGAGMYEEGQALERLQATMRNLADAAESGELPSCLRKVTNSAQILELLHNTYARNVTEDDPGGWRAPSILAPAPYPDPRIERESLAKIIPLAWWLHDNKGEDFPGLPTAEAVLARTPVKDAEHRPGEIKALPDEWEAIEAIARRILKARAEQLFPEKISGRGLGYDTLGWEWSRHLIWGAQFILDRRAPLHRALKMGLTTPAEWADAQAAMRALVPRAAGEDPVKKQIKDKERDLIGRKIPGYFPTPTPLAERLVELANLGPGMRVLEPSAGKGNIAEAIRQSPAEVKLEVIEWDSTLSSILKLKGFDLIGHDFFELKMPILPGDNTGSLYDRIIQNPPFEDGKDVDHVLHAYLMLKPGGRLVSIMGEHAFFANDKKSRAFREWLEDRGATDEKLPSGSFLSSERPTGVNCRLVVIDKPGNLRTPAEVEPLAALRDPLAALRVADVDPYALDEHGEPVWKYEQYEDWPRQLAKHYTVDELRKRLGLAHSQRGLLAQQRAAAGHANPDSMRNAQAGNVVRANYEERRALKNALAIHYLYPEHAKPTPGQQSFFKAEAVIEGGLDLSRARARLVLDYFAEHPDRVGGWERRLLIDAEEHLHHTAPAAQAPFHKSQLGLFEQPGEIKTNPANYLGVDKLGRAHWRAGAGVEARKLLKRIEGLTDQINRTPYGHQQKALVKVRKAAQARFEAVRDEVPAIPNLKDNPLVVSYGAGVDSTAMLIELAKRGIRPTAITFADTGGEHPETMAYLGIMQQWCERVRFPSISVVRYVPDTAPYDTLEGNSLANETVPGILLGRKNCSKKFKVVPQQRWTAQQPFAQAAFAHGHHITRAIGFEVGEERRTFAAEADEKEQPWYPLQEWGLTREDCVETIKAAGLPVPRKSACFFCPAAKVSDILQLAYEHPDLAARAIAIEDRAKSGKHPLRGFPGLSWGHNWRELLEGDAEVMARLREIDPSNRFGSVISFGSGASSPAEFAGFAMAGHPVGVVGPELSATVRKQIADYTDKHGRVFVDSGAFPAFRRALKELREEWIAAGAPVIGRTKKGKPKYGTPPDWYARASIRAAASMDWATKVWSSYDKLLELVNTPKPNGKGTLGLSYRLYMVMPDVIGDQEATLALQRHYADRIRDCIRPTYIGPDGRKRTKQGLRALVPIQLGALSPAAVYEKLRDEILHTNDFSVAVPSNEKAFSLDDLRDLARARPGGIHLLGIGKSGARLDQMIAVIRELAPQCSITTDSNRLRSWVGKTRPVTKRSRESLERISGLTPLPLLTDKKLQQQLRPTLRSHEIARMALRDLLTKADKIPPTDPNRVWVDRERAQRGREASAGASRAGPTFGPRRTTAARSRFLLHKAHISGYTRQSGSYVAPHEDRRRSSGYAGGHWQVSRCNNREECGGYILGHGPGKHCPRCFAPMTLQAGGAYFTEEEAERYIMGQSDAVTKAVRPAGSLREKLRQREHVSRELFYLIDEDLPAAPENRVPALIEHRRHLEREKTRLDAEIDQAMREAS